MSKDITIQEGGVGRQFGGVAKLRTDQQGGGSVYWVPEEEVQLTTKSITENGTYRASDDGVYGWDTINVSVAGGEGGGAGGIGSSIVGIDPTDGNEWMYTVDDGTGGGEPGEITSLKLPSSIAVTTPPSKTTYADGETINPSGIVVHGYYADGTDYGTLLNSELRYDPMVADISQTGEESTEWTVDTLTPPVYLYHLHEGELMPGNQVSETSRYYVVGDISATEPVYEMFMYSSASNQSTCTRIFCSLSPFIVNVTGIAPPGWGSGSYRVIGSAHTWNGDTIYTGGLTGNLGVGNLSVSAYQTLEQGYGIDRQLPHAATVALWGGHPTRSGDQPITVKWNRIGDGKELTTTFDITVTEAENSGESGGSGGSSGTSHWQEETGQYDP